jgi:ribokinase
MNGRPKVVVVGSSNTDLVVRCPQIPVPGETVLGRDFMTLGGGKGANQAVAAALLGAEVTFVGCTGDDAFGHQRRRQLESFGIDTRYMRSISAVPSGVALITVADNGENAIVVAAGANAHVSPEDVEAALPALQQAEIVLVQCEIPVPTVVYALKRAKQLGCTTLFNPAPAVPLPNDLLKFVDVLVPNEIEAARHAGAHCLGGSTPEETADALRKLGARNIIITLGSRGCMLMESERAVHLPAPDVDVVDTTAAGDTFCGALAFGIGVGRSLKDAAETALAAASLSVTKVGALDSMPTSEELRVFEQSMRSTG